MENLIQAVTEKLESITQKANASATEMEVLSAEEKEALRDAERLADLYEDIKPEPYVISSDHLFTLPEQDISI